VADGEGLVRPSLYHFSEDPTICCFVPQIAPTSAVREPQVWAVDAEHAHIYYFPRECPRVTFYRSQRGSDEDVQRFFATTKATRVVAIESRWLEAMRDTSLYRYEFPRDSFRLIDPRAGYWVSRETVVPLSVEPVGDLMTALTGAGVELRIIPSLWPLYEAVIASTLDFSIIRWRNASPRLEESGGSGGWGSSGGRPHPNPLPEGEGIRRQLLPEGEGVRGRFLPVVEGTRGRLFLEGTGTEDNPAAMQRESEGSLQEDTSGIGTRALPVSEVAEWAGGET
jgi:hypothetical protein